MRRGRWIVIGIGLLIAAGTGLGWHYTHNAAPTPAEEETAQTQPAATVKVRVVPIRRATVENAFKAYGTVAAGMGGTQTLSVPYESRVVRVLVAPGQAVEANTACVEVEPSPEARLQWDQAQAERVAAQQTLDEAKTRLGMQLATRQEVLQAEQQLHAAELREQNLKSVGGEAHRTIATVSPGVIGQVQAQAGAVVPAGGSLLEVVAHDKLRVWAGVDARTAATIRAGQAAHLHRIDAENAPLVDGRVEQVMRQMDAQTRLVNVVITPEHGDALLLNEYMRVDVVIDVHDGWVVPRSALVTDENDDVLFTVENGHAVRRVVTAGPSVAENTEVIGPGLAEGQSVVVQGNSELSDGTPVEPETGP